jgi:hypothetical protein
VSRTTYGLAAVGIGAATIVGVATPASAHPAEIGSPAGVGAAGVLANHRQFYVCVYNNVHSVRGEYKLNNGHVFPAVAGPYPTRPDGGCQTGNSEIFTITAVRACDPRGCSGWKEV